MPRGPQGKLIVTLIFSLSYLCFLYFFLLKKSELFVTWKENIYNFKQMKSTRLHFFFKSKFSYYKSRFNPIQWFECMAFRPTTWASSGKLGKFGSPEPESLVLRPSILYFNKPFRWFWGTVEIETHWLNKMKRYIQGRTDAELLFSLPPFFLFFKWLL